MHQLIAYAPQNAVLFEASLRENLLLGVDRPEKILKRGCNNWAWPTCCNAMVAWMHHCHWRRIPFLEARFTAWSAAGLAARQTP